MTKSPRKSDVDVPRQSLASRVNHQTMQLPSRNIMRLPWGHTRPGVLWNAELIDELKMESKTLLSEFKDEDAIKAFRFLLNSRRYEYLKELVRDLFVQNQQIKLKQD